MTTLRLLSNNVWTTATKTYSDTYFKFALLRWGRYEGGAGWQGTLGEGRLYNYPLTTADQDALIAQLRTKWNI